jgi:hypothetical protein
MVNSALVFTRGPVIAVYVHKGTDVDTGVHKGPPRIQLK